MMTRTEAEIEVMAEKIYLSKYEKAGGRWECVETKDVWREKAREWFRTGAHVANEGEKTDGL